MIFTIQFDTNKLFSSYEVNARGIQGYLELQWNQDLLNIQKLIYLTMRGNHIITYPTPLLWDIFHAVVLVFFHIYIFFSKDKLEIH